MRLPNRNPEQLRVRPLWLTAFFAAIIFFGAFSSVSFADQADELKRARSAVASGNLLEAQSLLEDFIFKFPEGDMTLMARYLLGEILYRRADYSGAFAQFEPLILEHPEWSRADRAAYGTAMAQLGLLDYSGAARTLDALLFTYPRSDTASDALYWLGESLYRRGHYAGALVRFEEFVEQYPDNPLREYAMDSMGWCLEQLGNNNEAVKAREMFLREYPSSSFAEVAVFQLATDYYLIGDTASSAQTYLSARSAAPPMGDEAMFRTGLVLAEQGRGQDAIPILIEALQRNLSETAARSGGLALAKSYISTRDYEKAEQLLQRIYNASSDMSWKCDVSFQLAMAQMGLEKFSEAARRLSVMRRHEACERLRYLNAAALAECLLRLDQPNIAAEELEFALEGDPSGKRPSDILFILAGSLVRARRYDEAGAVLEELSTNKQAVEKWPQIKYYEGLCLFRASQYSAAAQRFSEFLDFGMPSGLIETATYMEANSLLAIGERTEAARQFELFAEKWPDSSMASAAMYRAGLANYTNEKYEKSSELLEKVVQDHAGSPQAVPSRFFLAMSRMKLNDFDEALGQFRLILEQDPDFEFADKAAFAVGWIEQDRENHDVAAKIFTELPGKYPGTSLGDSALFLGAASHYRRGFLEVAGSQFARMHDLYPDSPFTSEALFWVGLCEEGLSNPEEAEEFYERALELAEDPDFHMQVLYSMAWNNMIMNDSEGATAALDGLIDEFPENPLTEQVRFLKGRLEYSNRQWQSATTDLLDMYKKFPDSDLADDAYFFAARAARHSTDYKQAIALLENLAREFPNSPLIEEAEIEIAECMIEAGRADEAARAFERFIENNLDSPLRPLALYDKGKALQRAGRFIEAIEQYKVAAGGERTELAARSRFAVSECFAELDRNGEAIAELISIARGGFPKGWSERAQLQVARLLERDGKMEEARQVYGTVAAMYGDDAAGMVALKALNRIEVEKQ